MRISDWSSDVCSSDLRRILHVDDPEPAGEPGGMDQAAVEPLVELMGAETAGGSAEGRLQLADGEDGERLDPGEVGHVEDPEEAVQASLDVLVLLVDGGGDAPRSEEHTSELQSL